MAVIVGMLRGVNVGGHNQIKMDALRALCTSLKLRSAQTYVQSGNVLFATDERDLPKLAKRLETAIAAEFNIKTDVILRTASELEDAIARNPFASRRGMEPSKLLVVFLSTTPSAEARDKVRKLKIEHDEVRMDGREVFIYFPNGMGRPQISWMTIVSALGTTGTGRNWNTVNKLFEMAQKLDVSA